MKLYELIDELQKLADKGHSEDKVRLLYSDDNPLNGESTDIKGAFVIYMHPDSEFDGVYIDGTN